jgi:glutathione-regulated potassium-efflux system ancillary protein KefG
LSSILILFAHPALEKSRVQARMVAAVRNIQGISFHDLYEAYPDFDIDVEREQELLLRHDVIIFQHPFYWYSCPAIIKQWEDLVLEHGWAYGTSGTALAGKRMFNAISVGGPEFLYGPEGRNRFTVAEFLRPFEQTATLCKMTYLPPYAIHGTHRLPESDIKAFALQYEKLIVAIRDDRFSPDDWRNVKYLNELVPVSQTIKY